jgi:hypothetical protein
MSKSSDIEQKERRRLAGSTTSATTYRELAEAGLNLEMQGRHAAIAKAQVVGAARVPLYPAQPEGSPWAGDQVPPEGPLGYAIDAQEVTGEAFEVAASLSIPLADAALATAVVDPAGAAPPCDASPSTQGGAILKRGRRL